jgi:hypothetical protein
MLQNKKNGFPLQVHYSAGRAVSLLGFGCIKSGSAQFSPDRQMFLREKKAVFPFIL